MKSLIISASLLLGSNFTFGQNIDSLGIDNNAYLNNQEVQFLNKTFKDENLAVYDFSNKKVAFVLGNATHKTLISKSRFFKCNIHWGLYYIVLTEKEKEESNGYDLIVTRISKMFLNSQKKKIIKQLAALD